MAKQNNIEDFGIEDTAGFKNLKAIIDYTKTTRSVVRELEHNQKIHLDQVRQQALEINGLKNVINQLRNQIYINGSTT